MPAPSLATPPAAPPPACSAAPGGRSRGPGIAGTCAGRPILGRRTRALRWAAAARSAFAAPPAPSPAALAVRFASGRGRLAVARVGRCGSAPLLALGLRAAVAVRSAPIAVRPVPATLAPPAVVAAHAVEADRLEHDRSLSPRHLVVQVDVLHRRPGRVRVVVRAVAVV